MKTALTLLASGLLTASAMAQPSFTILPSITNKQEDTHKAVDYAGDLSTSGGANKTWDFSTLDYSTAAAEVFTDHTDASIAPHAADFPEATWYTSGEQGGEPFEDYYQMTSDSYINVGYYGYGSVVHYSDPETIYSIPFLYDETQHDNNAYSYTHNGYVFTSTGTTSTKFDGYGTLIMPYGTITDVARLKITLSSTLEISTTGGTLYTTIVDDVIEYVWILPGAKDPLFLVAYVSSSQDGAAPELSVQADVYLPQETAGILKNDVASNALLYPQPATDQVTVMAENLHGDCNVKVFNLSGDVVATRKQLADAEKLTVDVQDLPTGMYMLEVINGDRTYRKKLVVQ